MQSYDYAHRTGVDDISWDRFAQLAATLSEQEIWQVIAFLRMLVRHALANCKRAGQFCAYRHSHTADFIAAVFVFVVAFRG